VLEVADIVRAVGPAYRTARAGQLSPEQQHALRDIADCRTAARGGQLWRCDDCSAERYVYHSCRNRHCPKCHREQTRRWLDDTARRLLPCRYFLFTFTLPDALRSLARAHPRLVYGVLFRAAARALLALCADPRFLGARPGLLAVLHTWTRALLYHPHVHVLVSAGGLAPDGTWRTPRHARFLVPAYVLSTMVRARVHAALRRRHLDHLVPPDTWKRPWVVHGQYAGDGDGVLRYLARYVFRVALPNSRLVSFDDDRVRFRYVDRKSGSERTCTLGAHDFLDRFVQHVLPPGLTKVRAYGLFSTTARPALEQARTLFPDPADDTPRDAPQPLVIPVEHCPHCRTGTLRLIRELPRVRSP
jgi:hypothetical protein